MTPCSVEVRGDSRDFTPGHLLVFCRCRTALRRQTAIRQCTCGAPHARSQGGAELWSFCGGHFAFELDLASLAEASGKIMMSQDIGFVVL